MILIDVIECEWGRGERKRERDRESKRERGRKGDRTMNFLAILIGIDHSQHGPCR